MDYQVVDRMELNLPEKITPIIDEIESRLGRPIVFAMTDKIPGAEASAGIEDDGTPLVLMGAQGKREMTVVHEILHLECEVQGFPRTRSRGGTAKLPEDQVGFAISEWFSIAEHQVIYPRMEKLGYDPRGDLDGKFRSELLEPMANIGQFLYCNPNRDILFLNLVGKATRVFTEAKRTLRKLMTASLGPFPTELQMSQKLANRILAVKEWTPAVVKEIAESCLEDLGIPRIGIYTYIPQP